MPLPGVPGERCAGKSFFFFFFFADWKCSCLIYKTVLMLVKADLGCGVSALPEDNFELTHLFINVPK